MPKAHQFKVGDVVMLKSGGPEMTVNEVGESLGEPLVRCTWFAGKKNERASFKPETLIPVPDRD